MDNRSWADRLPPLVSAARALDYVHRQGLVHRDVKAGNILIDQDNQPHLTDFGIAGIYRIDADRSTVHSGGSRHCMSPQQRQGLPPHPADDIYSFGILLLETLTPADRIGNAPLSADDIRRSFRTSTDTPPELVDTVVHMLADRSRRPSRHV